jgi:hypothetical protein
MTGEHPNMREVPTAEIVCGICTGPKLANEAECSACRNGPPAYQPFKETDACARCGEGESWTVKGPDGLCIGQSWEGEEAECNAIETAEMLNAAFEAGKRVGLGQL